MKAAWMGNWISKLFAKQNTADGKGYGLRDGDLFELPISKYYETTVSHVPGTSLVITHNFGVIPKSVECELVYKAAVNGMTIGETAEATVVAGIGSAAGYNAEFRKKTTTQVTAVLGANGMAGFSAVGVPLVVTAAQADFKIKVYG